MLRQRPTGNENRKLKFMLDRVFRQTWIIISKEQKEKNIFKGNTK